MKLNKTILMLLSVIVFCIVFFVLIVWNHSVDRLDAEDGVLYVSKAAGESSIAILCGEKSSQLRFGSENSHISLKLDAPYGYCLYVSGCREDEFELTGGEYITVPLGRKQFIAEITDGTEFEINYKVSYGDFLNSTICNIYLGTMEQIIQKHEEESVLSKLPLYLAVFAAVYSVSIFVWKPSEKYLLIFALHTITVGFWATPLPRDLMAWSQYAMGIFLLFHTTLSNCIHGLLIKTFVDDRIGKFSYLWYLVAVFALMLAVSLSVKDMKVLAVMPFVVSLIGYSFEGYIILRNHRQLDEYEPVYFPLVLTLTWSISFSIWVFRALCNLGFFEHYAYSLGGLIGSSYTIGFLLVINAKFGKRYGEAQILTEKLALANDTLEHRVEEKTRALEQAHKEKETFLAGIVHNIKTPLFSVTGYSEMLRTEVSELPEYARNWLEIVLDNIQYVQELVRKLLLSMRLESGDIRLDAYPFSIQKMLLEIMETSKTASELAGVSIKLETQDDIEYTGDKFYIKQAVQILVDNAMEASSAGHAVYLSFGTDGETTNIYVRDEGIGIPEEALEHIFEQYYSGKTNSKRASGLGLFIAKSIALKHGGSIEVSSEEGHGSEFVLKLGISTNFN